ncbi:hypothetical protein DL546_005774 [Coniochaeta pulveracea]|uniref:Proteasome assembly chaperone 3 n=1 Tax=Coniochaeta pulveracea TaxID=177199 RepID=A0A420YAM0_9PEZI|nr:hypothetical protein DL546_005774 [Coniochaeta pulveracea]
MENFASLNLNAEAPIHVSVPLPRSIDSRIYLHLTARAKHMMLFITTASLEDASTPTPLGSFVYALPDRFNPDQPLSTPLYREEPTLEFTSRLAKLVAKKTGLPAYVGNSVSLASMGMGGTVEEEMEAFKTVVETLVPLLNNLVDVGTHSLPNGQ